MPNIVLTRIDNRLIHGQVATQWCGIVGANLLLVANDKVAGDDFRQGLMNMAAPAYAQTRYFTIEKTCAIIDKASPAQKLSLIHIWTRKFWHRLDKLTKFDCWRTAELLCSRLHF